MNWKKITLIIAIFTLHSSFCNAQNRSLDLSNKLIFAIYQHQKTNNILTDLENLTTDQLAADLFNDSMKNSFWINIYNSVVQLSAPDSLERNHNKKYFKKKRIKIAGNHLSLDDIEHGLLRHSKSAKGKKIKSKRRVSDFEEQFRVEKPDWRIFFTLNTALVSDPYISFYNPLDYNNQLKLASMYYLKPLIHNGTLSIPSRFKWYFNDAQGMDAVKLYANSLKLEIEVITIAPHRPYAIKLNYFIGSQ